MKNYTMVLHLSDLHYGKTTKSFNKRVFAARLKEYAKAAATLAELLPHRNAQVAEIILLINGDIVDGENIYEYHNAVNQDSAIRQAKGAAKKLVKFCDYLVREINPGKFTVIGTRGNHGRMGHEANPESNWDSVCVDYLESMWDTKNILRTVVTFKNVLEPYATVEVNSDVKILVEHEGVKHSITPANLVRTLNKLLATGCNVLINGHWHKSYYRKYWDFHHVVNGTIVSDDEYAHALGTESDISQSLLLIHGKDIYHHRIELGFIS